MKKAMFILLGVLLSFLLIVGIAFADESLNSQTIQQITKEINPDVEKAIKKEIDPILKKAKKEISGEAVKVVENSAKIIELLDKKQKDEALSLIETSIGKLEIILNEHPEISLLPVSITAKIYDTILTLSEVKENKELVKTLVAKGYLQDARIILEGMVSEINIQEKNLPLITYPKALSIAAILIKKDKIDEAKKVIQDALNALIIKENIIPLPLLKAQVILEKVSSLIENKGFSKEKVITYLKVADYEISMAEELGYGKRDKEFKDLHSRIEDIKEKISANEESKGLVKQLLDRLLRFRKRIFNKKEEKNE